jgi:hypothetical protein
MALAYKSLGQQAPVAATLTTLYTAPVMAVGSSLVICNRGAATTVRVAVSPAGAAIANQHYLLFDAPLDANATDVLTLGIALAATDVVRVYNTLATVSFTLFGVEIS